MPLVDEAFSPTPVGEFTASQGDPLEVERRAEEKPAGRALQVRHQGRLGQIPLGAAKLAAFPFSGPPVVTTGKTWPIPATCQSPSESRNIRCCIWCLASGSIAGSICCAGACRGSRNRTTDVTTARAVATDRYVYTDTSPWE